MQCHPGIVVVPLDDLCLPHQNGDRCDILIMSKHPHLGIHIMPLTIHDGLPLLLFDVELRRKSDRIYHRLLDLQLLQGILSLDSHNSSSSMTTNASLKKSITNLPDYK